MKCDGRSSKENKADVMKVLAPICIILAGVCWGILGLFVRNLGKAQISSPEMTFLKCAITAIALLIYLAIVDRAKLKIKLKDIWMFLGTGIMSIVFFGIMYCISIQTVELSVAVILLYTAPVFVMIMSILFFKERLTVQKAIALLLAMVGCCFSSGLIESLILGNGLKNISVIGVLSGLASGFGYALYSIFGNVALKKYSSLTVTTYTFSIATLALAPFCLRVALLQKVTSSPSVLLNVLGIGLISTLVAYILYTIGLSRVEPGEASVMAFVEPMVATLASVLVLHERLSWAGMIGIVLIFVAIVILNLKNRKEIEHEERSTEEK